MIRRSASARLARAVLVGGIVAFMIVAAAANALSGAGRDAVGLLLGAAAFASIGLGPWLQFVEVTDGGLRYRNLLIRHVAAWRAIESFSTRTLHQRGGGIAVVAHLRSGRRTTLRATNRPTRYGAPGSPGRAFVENLADQLNGLLQERG